MRLEELTQLNADLSMGISPGTRKFSEFVSEGAWQYQTPQRSSMVASHYLVIMLYKHRDILLTITDSCNLRSSCLVLATGRPGYPREKLRNWSQVRSRSTRQDHMF
ncbi:hypothetical protein J6590_093113 [Homalodisca vitripennis]|nr:hypothetical protein J6590_093113 [Homalodisca vitripennis]